jgi:hypothetical protein
MIEVYKGIISRGGELDIRNTNLKKIFQEIEENYV